MNISPFVIAIIVLILIGAAGLILYSTSFERKVDAWQHRSDIAIAANRVASKNITAELRDKALSLSADQIGINRQNHPSDVWGIVFEFSIDDETVTLLVLADRTVSIYYTTGGGTIGAGMHESVWKHANRFLEIANTVSKYAEKTMSFPHPVSGEVVVYMLTYDGVYMTKAQEEALGSGDDKLSAFFFAAHNVIAAVRERSEME